MAACICVWLPVGSATFVGQPLPACRLPCLLRHFLEAVIPAVVLLAASLKRGRGFLHGACLFSLSTRFFVVVLAGAVRPAAQRTVACT